MKTQYLYYETDKKGKPKKKDQRQGNVEYTYDDEGRILVADFYYQDGSPSNKDVYSYNSDGTIQTLKKSKVLGIYGGRKTEKVYAYEFTCDGNGNVSAATVEVYNMENGAKGPGKKQKLQSVSNFSYPNCFKAEDASKYQRDDKNLIVKLQVDKKHVQTFKYEFY